MIPTETAPLLDSWLVRFFVTLNATLKSFYGFSYFGYCPIKSNSGLNTYFDAPARKTSMTQRSDKEMTALLSKFNDQIGPMDKWSDEALEVLNDWLASTGETVEHEWVKRDSDSEADA